MDFEVAVFVRQRGFTLIELLVVVAIIGLITSIAAPVLADAMSRARRAAFETDAQQLHAAFTKYYVDNGLFPSTSAPVDRALHLTTLAPLSTNGYYAHGVSLTSKLSGGTITAYDSPNIGGPDTQYWAVLTLAADPSVVLLVANTNDYPDDQGTWYNGVYVINGSSIVPIGED